jgi:surface polysaccharide O-acyltransferase-like enzyme
MMKTNRIVWLDTMRLVAMFALVCCHCTDPFNFYPGTSPDIGEIKLWGALYGALVRPCVPLFVMITGALLLPVKDEMQPFYKKRILRVLWPFLIWSVVYALFPWLTGVLGFGSKVVLDCFPYAGDIVTRQDFSVALQYIGGIAFNFSPIAVHMWYIYLLIGLYLYMPIFSAWVEKASDKAKLFVLILWGVTLLIPYFNQFVSPYLWGTCSWNAYGMLYSFAGFNGYLLLGHYLRRINWPWRRTLGVSVPLFAVGYLVTFFGFRYMTSLPDCTDDMLELFFTYCSLNVMAMTFAVFMIVKKIEPKNEKFKALLANLTLCGFGVYMIHYFFTGPAVSLIRLLGIPIPLQIAFASVIAFAVSWAIVAIIKKYVPKSKIIVG